jgi:CRP-like cAMP-binding protein
MMVLGPYLTRIVLRQGFVCHEPADPIRQVYFPVTGMISLLVLMADGHGVETASIGREGGAGLQAALGESSSGVRAIVSITGSFHAISAIQFGRAVSSNAILANRVYRHLETLLINSRQMAACNAVHDCPARLCRCLLQVADRIGNERVPITQQSLARMLGVRRTTVSLVASQLAGRSLIKYIRGSITILDRPSLESAACECYRVMRDEQAVADLACSDSGVFALSANPRFH